MHIKYKVGKTNMEVLKLKAYAKINLGLDVIGVKPNGYHIVKMIMQNIGIYDELTFEKSKEGILLKMDTLNLPNDGNNLIYKTTKLMKEEYDIQEGVIIHLKKKIPIAAGMAGGSSDAAAVIKGINQLFGLSLTIDEMCKIGVRIGADVPYCIMGGTALAEGIGEELTALPDAPKATLLVAKPDINVSTKEVYEKLDTMELKFHPDIDGMVQSVLRQDLRGIVERMGNVLEFVTCSQYPVIDELKSFMESQGALKAMMSGSGPTVFGVFAEQEQAAKAYLEIKKNNLSKELFVTTFVTPIKEEI